MQNKRNIIEKVKQTVKSVAPDATVLLYGSYARNEEKPNSDIDLLILLNKENITWEDEKKITFPLYDIEFEEGIIVSPLVLSKIVWEKRHRITPFFENISKEGIVL
jgi:predicted nucleotidyltransferase